MPSTHTSLHFHLIFSTKDRYPLIAKEWQDRLHAYLGGLVRHLGGLPDEVNGMADKMSKVLPRSGFMTRSDLANLLGRVWGVYRRSVPDRGRSEVYTRTGSASS
jgi:hypothetical protein